MISPRNAWRQAEGDHCYAECRSEGNAHVCHEIRQAFKRSERLLCITILAALNKPFGEWNQVFPNAACVVALVDRLVHRSEILTLAGNSYRLKEAQERAARRASQRGAAKKAR